MWHEDNCQVEVHIRVIAFLVFRPCQRKIAVHLGSESMGEAICLVMFCYNWGVAWDGDHS